MKKRHFVVTGGAGFIGSHITDALVARGDKVTVIDDLSSGTREMVNSQAIFHQVDIRDVDALNRIFKTDGIDGVFHCAAIISVQYSIEHPEETKSVNREGTKNVLEVSSQNGVKRAVFCSSAAVYGATSDSAVSESTPANPQSPYGMDKEAGEKEFLQYAHQSSLESVILRYFNVYGPRQRGDSPYAGVIARFIQRKKDMQPMTIFGDGSQTRDFVHVSDVVSANLKAMDEPGISGQVINIGSGSAVSVKDIANIIGGNIEHAPAREEVKNSLADISKAKSVLHWEPQISLREGIRELLVL
ncbi:MAG: hypothetical protein RLY66_513 [Candidatus Parcubacteria bacterium]|jgi:UDP-glucose 4-epimerase